MSFPAISRRARQPYSERRHSARRNYVRPSLEALEDRVVPAFDLSVSTGLTANVSVNTAAGVTTYTATGTGATVNNADIVAQLNLGNNVVISSGSTGAEAGTITVVNGVVYTGLGARSLTLISGTGASVVGDIIINDAITATGTTLNVEARALRHVEVNADVNAGAGNIMLSADVTAAALADNGVGTLSVAAAATVSSTAQITLHGAVINLAGDVDLASRLTLEATTGGAAQASGAITVNQLALTGTGNFTLNQTENDIATLAANINGSLTLQEKTNVSIGTVGALSGVVLVGGNLTLNVGGSVAVNAPINVGVGNVALNIGLQTALATAVNATFGTGATLTAGSASLTGRVGGTDTLHGPDVNSIFVLSGVGSGTLANASFSTALAFSEMEKLEGGILGDVFFIANSAALIASIDGGAGFDFLKFGRIADINLNVTGGGALDGFAGAAAGVTAFTNINGRGNIAFAVGADNLIRKRLFDLAGNPLRNWAINGPVRFVKVVVGAWGADHAALVFGLGVDGRVYVAKYNNLGARLTAWTAISAQVFDDISVGTYGTTGASIVFGIRRLDKQVFSARFNAQGNIVSGFQLVANGRFRAIAVGQVGVNGEQPILFCIRHDGLTFYARFDASGNLRIGYSPLSATWRFRELAVATRADGTVHLFGLHGNQRVSLARFNVDGSLAADWSLVSGDLRFRSISAAQLGAGDLAGIVHGDANIFAGVFNRTNLAAGFNGAGVQTTSWITLTQGLFQDLGISGDASILFGTDINELDLNPLDDLFSGFFEVGGKAFTSIALS